MATCINDQFVKSQCYCLNEQTSNQFTNTFVGDHTLGVHSDSDEQLIIHLAFVQTFRLSGLTLGVMGDGTCPCTIKMFANQPSLGFSDASDTVPTQQLVVKGGEDGQPTVLKVDLQAAKWQRADSITLFIEDNHGAESTFLHSIKVFGVPVHGTNVAEISSG